MAICLALGLGAHARGTLAEGYPPPTAPFSRRLSPAYVDRDALEVAWRTTRRQLRDALRNWGRNERCGMAAFQIGAMERLVALYVHDAGAPRMRLFANPVLVPTPLRSRQPRWERRTYCDPVVTQNVARPSGGRLVYRRRNFTIAEVELDGDEAACAEMLLEPMDGRDGCASSASGAGRRTHDDTEL